MDVKKSVLKEEFEDNKGVIRIRRSKKDRQHNEHERLSNFTLKTQNQIKGTLLFLFCIVTVGYSTMSITHTIM